MNSPQPQRLSSSAGSAAQALLNEGDSKWASRPAQWRERELALPWNEALLHVFCLRMASHGMSVSRTLMMCDRRYALQQLDHAHNMADDVLRSMAVSLFRQCEGRISDLESPVH
jgi:hypothetical protein